MVINLHLFGGRGTSSGMYSKYSYKNLPKNPDDLVKNGWKDITDERNQSQSRDFYNPKTNDKVRFDKGQKGKSGFRGKDHYHWHNPKSKGKNDYYLDKNGNPVPKQHKNSHLLP